MALGPAARSRWERERVFGLNTWDRAIWAVAEQLEALGSYETFRACCGGYRITVEKLA